MGFTRYWDNLTPSAELAEAVEKIVEASNAEIRGGFGEGEPGISANQIWLNGDGEAGEDHETFYITPEPNWRGEVGWGFCKTNYKPYDEVVAASLIAAVMIDPKVEVRRDGNFPKDDEGGIALFEKVFGKIPPNTYARLAQMSRG